MTRYRTIETTKGELLARHPPKPQPSERCPMCGGRLMWNCYHEATNRGCRTLPVHHADLPGLAHRPLGSQEGAGFAARPFMLSNLPHGAHSVEIRQCVPNCPMESHSAASKGIVKTARKSKNGLPPRRGHQISSHHCEQAEGKSDQSKASLEVPGRFCPGLH